MKVQEKLIKRFNQHIQYRDEAGISVKTFLKTTQYSVQASNTQIPSKNSSTEHNSRTEQIGLLFALNVINSRDENFCRNILNTIFNFVGCRWRRKKEMQSRIGTSRSIFRRKRGKCFQFTVPRIIELPQLTWHECFHTHPPVGLWSRVHHLSLLVNTTHVMHASPAFLRSKAMMKEMWKKRNISAGKRTTNKSFRQSINIHAKGPLRKV